MITSKRGIGDNRLDAAYEWLARKGIIQGVSTPVKLTLKSQVEMEEAAYYYDPDTAGTTGKLCPPKLKQEAHSRIMDALDTFVDKVKDDRYLIAAILTSNLAEDNVWEHTDINSFSLGATTQNSMNTTA